MEAQTQLELQTAREHSEKKARWKFRATVGAVLAITVGVWMYGFIAWENAASKEQAGQKGDSFGVITSLFNALAFLGVIVTVWMQKQELGLQREELRLTREELQKSALAQTQSANILKDQLLIQVRDFRQKQREKLKNECISIISQLNQGSVVVGNLVMGATAKPPLKVQFRPVLLLGSDLPDLNSLVDQAHKACEAFDAAVDEFTGGPSIERANAIGSAITHFLHAMHSLSITASEPDPANRDECARSPISG